MAENVMGDNYYTSMDREYAMKDEPVAGITVFEGVDGRFPTAVASKIKMGADAVELQLSQEDFSKGMGAESYGKEARQDIKDLAAYNDIKINSVHISHLPNMSGYDGKEGFNERVRDQIINEIRKEIDFAADVTNGASVVVHTGEFPRAMAKSGRFKEFELYPGEEKEAMIGLADKQSGQAFAQIRSDQEFTFVKPKRDEKTGKLERDKNGNVVPEWATREEEKKYATETDFEPVTVNKYRDELLEKAKELKNLRNAKEFFIDNHKLDQGGLSHDELMNLDERELASMAFFIDLQSNKLFEARSNYDVAMAEYQHYKHNSELARGEAEKNSYRKMAESYRERAAAVAQQQEEIKKQINRTVPMRSAAMIRTEDTLAQAGVIAMDKTKEKHLKNPLVMTPENIFPWDFGSHPDEMIEMVQGARDRMVKLLTNPRTADMKGREIDNPFWHKGLSAEQAKKLASEHIKATLDTQHLGMWKKHFERKPGETEEQRDKRFNKWYTKQVENLADKGIIGNVHLVDGLGLGHSHLPAGQGRYPVAEAIEKLRAKGFTGPISSEGHGEGPERQLASAWEMVGKPTGLYHAATQQAQSWTDVSNSYFGSQRYPPGYIVGDFAKKISPDFTLWSGVPLE
ncbi:sugar phosphate isomerase/epimerase [Candidatus Woesearchaeota archaeon]|nr:sugar phosphate isomerase/epimerase [Candidatus Woesearchaeota archaeon]